MATQSPPKAARTKALRECVEALLSVELQNPDEAAYWAVWIADRIGVRAMVNYLDLNNQRPEEAASIIARLGFDPRPRRSTKHRNNRP